MKKMKIVSTGLIVILLMLTIRAWIVGSYDRNFYISISLVWFINLISNCLEEKKNWLRIGVSGVSFGLCFLILIKQLI